MPSKKDSRPAQDIHSSQGRNPRAGGNPTESRARPNTSKEAQEQGARPRLAQVEEATAPGLDPAKHAAAQRVAHQAEVMRETLFPAMFADVVGFEKLFDSKAYKVYLDRLLDDAGSPSDPIERMLIEQLAMGHFRIGQLNVKAAHAETLEGVKITNAAVARLWGEFRRTALALRAYRERTHDTQEPKSRLKLFREAQ